MSKKESFTPAWTEEAPRQGTYRSIFKWGDPTGFKHPNRGFYGMIKDVFRDDRRRLRPTSGGRERSGRVRATDPAFRRADPDVRGNRRQGERPLRRLLPREVRGREDDGRGDEAQEGNRRERARPRPASPEQGGCAEDRRLLQRAGNPDLPLRRGLFRDLRVSVRQGRGLPGDEHPHASRPGLQRDEPDDHRRARHPGAGVREDAERCPRSVQGKAEIHGRPLPAVLRILLGGRLDRGARVRRAILLLRRHVRHRAQPGIRDACRLLQDPGLSRHRNRAEGQRHHEGERGDVRRSRECHLEALQARCPRTGSTSATCSPPGRRRWTPRGRSRKGNSACPACSAFRIRKRPTWG